MPKRHPQNKSLFFVTQTGCLLPFLIAANLVFGWLFFKPLTWLLIEGTLILLLIITARITMSKILSRPPKHHDAIDIEGGTLEE